MPASFLPAVALAVVFTALSTPRVARALTVGWPVAALLVQSVGIVLAATLSPIPPAVTDAVPGWCDTSRVGPLPASELLSLSEATLNVALFVPLGAMVAFVPRRRDRLAVAAGAAALPVALEATQLLVPALGRSCQTADVFDNSTGLLVGLGLGATSTAIARVLRTARPGPRGRDRADGPSDRGSGSAV